MYEAFALGVFGVAWALGALIRSATISACVSITVLIATAFLTATNLDASNLFSSRFVEAMVDLVVAGLGIAGIAAGTVCYVRRVSPGA